MHRHSVTQQKSTSATNVWGNKRSILTTEKMQKMFNEKSIHPSIHRSMGSVPVGAQCPLTSSLGEFLSYRDWLWYPGLSPVLVSIALPFAFHISVFSIRSSSSAPGFRSSIFLRWRYLHPTTNPPP